MPTNIRSISEPHSVAFYVCDNPACTYGVAGAPSEYRVGSGAVPFIQVNFLLPNGNQISGQACTNGPTRLYCLRQYLASLT